MGKNRAVGNLVKYPQKDLTRFVNIGHHIVSNEDIAREYDRFADSQSNDTHIAMITIE